MILANDDEVRDLARFALRWDEFSGPRPGGHFLQSEAWMAQDAVLDSVAFAIEGVVSTGPWIKRSHNGTDRVYHTDRNCPYAQRTSNLKEATGEEVETYGECDWCSGEFTAGGSSGPDLSRIVHDIGRARDGE